MGGSLQLLSEEIVANLTTEAKRTFEQLFMANQGDQSRDRQGAIRATMRK